MPIDRLSAEDQLMLEASRAWPQDVCALALLDGSTLFDEAGRFRVEAVREAIEGRLHLAPRFRQVIRVPRRGRGAPHWVDARSFDLAKHVMELPLEPPAGKRELLLVAEQLRRQRLDPSRPLWGMWFLTGLPERQVGLFVRINHAMADGLAAMSILSAFLDRSPEAPPGSVFPWRPAAGPSDSELVADNLARRLAGVGRSLTTLGRPRKTLRRVRDAWPATRELIAEKPSSRTSLNRLIGADCDLALVRSSYAAVRKVGRAHDASVNDVLLAATAAGLRALLASRGEPVDGVTMRTFVPVSLRRRRHGPAEGTLIAQMVVPLRLGRADPGGRLEGIAGETTRRKARSRASLGTLFGGAIARRLMLMAVVRQRVNVTTASVPGPNRPLYLAGARVLELFPVLALIGNVPLGIGALSYAGTWNIGIIADRTAIPDLDVFAAAVRSELRALGVEAKPQQPAEPAPAPEPGRLVGAV